MSELKAYIVYIPREGVVEGLWKSYAIRIDGVEIYLKSDADKVIAGLKESRMGWIHRCGVAEEGERHQKYKRCLAMAKWCDTKGDWYYSIGESFRDRVEFYKKWHKRWLELAEKFKEAK